MVFGISAGLILGLYDFWTKKSMDGNDVISIVFFSSFFGMAAWGLVLTLGAGNTLSPVNLFNLGYEHQLLIAVKSMAMTLSWILAYYAVKALPMSFSGAVRASGPLWTMAGGVLIFGEYLTATQFFLLFASIAAYYALSQIGKKEGIDALKSKPVMMMLAATIFSAVTTVYDKYLVQSIGLTAASIQINSSVQRFLIALVIFYVYKKHSKIKTSTTWSVYIPLVGISWVVAEYVYFLAIVQADSNVTYLSVFRRMSLVVGFILSAIFIGEKYLKQKTIIILVLVLSTVALILERH
ncbi:MAG: EamA family transporter [Comamonas sp.]|uniref:EamA family transporter n=1 Tax=Comamonas sp. TaxID=34028 RepID=UPI003D112E08